MHVRSRHTQITSSLSLNTSKVSNTGEGLWGARGGREWGAGGEMSLPVSGKTSVQASLRYAHAV